jgi:hypothetical protein
MAWPRVLIYKRNHTGDPDQYGTFGYGDCMGRIRGYAYDAVIGIGVTNPWAGHEDIADRITWVGVGPQQVGIHPARNAPLIRFQRWNVFDAKGKDLKDFAPRLAEYYYAKHRRYFFSDGLHENIQRDIARILRLARRRCVPMGNLDTTSLIDCLPGCPPRKRCRRRSVC